MRRAARLLRRRDLVEDLRVVAGEHRAAVDDHVDLVGPELDRAAHVGELHVERRLPARERGGDARDLDARPGERLLRDGHEVRIDADRRARPDGRVAVERRERLRGTSAAPCPAVSFPSSVVRSIIAMASLSPATFAAFLMRALAERRRALLDGDLVDRRGRRIEERIRRRPRARPVAGQRDSCELTRATLAEGEPSAAGAGRSRLERRPSLDLRALATAAGGFGLLLPALDARLHVVAAHLELAKHALGRRAFA